MAANIQTMLNGDVATTAIGSSRDDLRTGDVVRCTSEDPALFEYAWELTHTPTDSDGNVSGASLTITDNYCEFTVDNEGPYLIRLLVDPGTEAEDQQYLRLRSLTKFGSLKLVASGEQIGDASVPSDATGAGWALDQNYNLRELLSHVSRLSASGRLLYVDANRGRNSENDQNTETAEGHADFYTIQEAVDFAAAGGMEGVGADLGHIWTIMVRPGRYVEDLNIPVGINLIGMSSKGAVKIENTAEGQQHQLFGGWLHGITFYSEDVAMEEGFLSIDGPANLIQCHVIRYANGASQGPCVEVLGGTATLQATTLTNIADNNVGLCALGVHGSGTVFVDNCTIDGAQGIRIFDGAATATVRLSTITSLHVDGAAIHSSGTLSVSNSKLISTNTSLLVDPSTLNPELGGETHILHSELTGQYSYDPAMGIPSLRVSSVEMPEHVETGNIVIDGAVRLTHQENQPPVNPEPSVWSDVTGRVHVDENKLAFDEDLASLETTFGTTLVAHQTMITDLQTALSEAETRLTAVEVLVSSLTVLGVQSIPRTVVIGNHTCLPEDVYISVKTTSATDHLLILPHLEEEVTAGRRLFITDETGLGRVLVRPMALDGGVSTINGNPNDLILKNRASVQIISSGSTEDGLLEWFIF